MIRRRAEHFSDKNQFNEVTYLLCNAIVVEIDMYRISTVLYLPYAQASVEAEPKLTASQPVNQSTTSLPSSRYLPTIPFFLKCSTVKL